MSEKHVNLIEGDTLIVHAVARTPAPAPQPEQDLEVLLTIGNVNIYQSLDETYVCFKSDLDICNDGSGPPHDDVSYQPMTAYWNGGNFLNADKDKYIVIPPQIRSMTAGVVMGCQAKLTNLETGVVTPAVVGDIGPSEKTGEAAYCAAKVVNPGIGHNTGDTKQIYLYELWPDVPAVVDGKTYKLEPA